MRHTHPSEVSRLPSPGAEYPIRMNRFDLRTTEQMRSASGEWRTLEETRTPEWSAFPRLLETTFSSLYKPKPIDEERPLTRSAQAIRDLLSAVGETQEWHSFRQDTVLDEMASALGALHLARTLTLPQEEDEHEEAEYKPLSEEGRGEVRRAARAAIHAAREAVEEQRAMESLLWGNESADHRRGHSPEERVSLAAYLQQSRKLQHLLRLVGRFRAIAETQYKRRTHHGHDELVDLELGGEIRDVLPAELVQLVLPETELLFLSRLAERELLQYRFEATEKVGRGPILALVDISGSMGTMLTGPNRYHLPNLSKLEWALSTTLALSVQARKERRDLEIALFNTQIRRQYQFPKGAAPAEALLEIASTEVSGGTSFEVPLTHALERIEHASGTRDADLIFLTDGDCSVSADFLRTWEREKERLGFRSFGILFHTTPNAVLDRLSEVVVRIGSLAEGDAALEHAFAL